MEQIHQNEAITVWLERENSMVRHQVHKWARGDAFRLALSAGAEAMEKYKLTRWLSDDRENQVLPADDELWAKTVWFPRVKAAGWKAWAIVKPEKAIATMNMQRFATEYRQFGIEAMMFSDLQQAEQWLRRQ